MHHRNEMHGWRAGLALFAGLGALIAQACGTEPEGRVLAARQEALWTTGSIEFWPDGRVPVCFHARTEDIQGTPDYVQQTTRFRQVIENAYESIPGVDIDFYGFQECADRVIGAYPGQLRVIVNPSSSSSVWFTRQCEYGTDIADTGACLEASGYSAERESIVFVKGRKYAWGNDWDTVALHEVAHVLGFKHEMARDDWDGACQDPNSGTGAGLFLTEYDPGSITLRSYCGYDPRLTELDKLGLEIVYPAVFEHPMLGTHALPFQGGLATRTEGKLMGDWTARGALDDAFAWNGLGTGLPDFYWFTPGVVERVDFELPATDLGPGVHEVRAGYFDFRERVHDVRTTRVVVGNAAHTAVLLSALF